ncbi:hypothetical protein ACFYNO_10870 [Kitasatospora sp. NPDC006697]
MTCSDQLTFWRLDDPDPVGADGLLLIATEHEVITMRRRPAG